MRGAQTQLNDGTFVVGIIPADARSTGTVREVDDATLDHPRGREEH